MRVREARHAVGVIAGASWLGATMALALLWCGSAFAAQPKVVLLRGWFGVFSSGLDSLADELKAKGVHAQVAGHLSWKTAVSDILRERAAGKTGPAAGKEPRSAEGELPERATQAGKGQRQ